jgi:hypothetical protein
VFGNRAGRYLAFLLEHSVPPERSMSQILPNPEKREAFKPRDEAGLKLRAPQGSTTIRTALTVPVTVPSRLPARSKNSVVKGPVNASPVGPSDTRARTL